MRPPSDADTIAAISTAPGEGGIGIVRISGKDALRVAARVFEPKSGVSPLHQKPYTAQYGQVVDRPRADSRRGADSSQGANSRGGAIPSVTAAPVIDEALLFVMRAPKSYTREDMAEISCHGGRYIVEKVFELCLASGARPAEPGEFTQRAFLNGRLDLAQAESVLDLIRAKTELSRKAAQSQLDGDLSRFVTGLRDELADVLSHIEASIDFPDDRIEPMGGPETRKALEAFRLRLARALERSRSGLILREGLKTALVGRPNVGKSSLMNALVRSNRVIVSAEPGTTRDLIEEEVRIGGCRVRLTDTAGLGAAGSAVEADGMRRTESAIDSSDLVLFVVDGSAGPSEEDSRIRARLGGKPHFLVVNKSDTLQPEALPAHRALSPKTEPVLTSCLSLTGIEELERRISGFVLRDVPESADEAWAFSARHSEHIRRADEHIAEAIKAYETGLSCEFAAADVRNALDELGSIVGQVVTEDILDKIFSNFCIGK